MLTSEELAVVEDERENSRCKAPCRYPDRLLSIIDKLQAKLADTVDKLDWAEKRYDSEVEHRNSHMDECEKLRAQLAESEKTIHAWGKALFRIQCMGNDPHKNSLEGAIGLAEHAFNKRPNLDLWNASYLERAERAEADAAEWKERYLQADKYPANQQAVEALVQRDEARAVAAQMREDYAVLDAAAAQMREALHGAVTALELVGVVPELQKQALSLDAGEVYRQEHEWLRTKYREHQARADTLGGELKRTEKERDDLKLRLEHAEKRAEDYRAEREAARDMADVERKRADELNRELEDANDHDAVTRMQYEKLLGENSQLQAQVHKLETLAYRDQGKPFPTEITWKEEAEQLQAQVAALASRNTTLEDRIKCVCYHAPEQHGPSGCQATHKLNRCECPWDGIPVSTADAAKAYEAKIRAEERNRCARRLATFVETHPPGVEIEVAAAFIRALSDAPEDK